MNAGVVGQPRAAKDADQRLGEAIRTRRKAIGMSRQALAAAAGVSFQQIHKYESGVNRIAFSRLVQIARVLQTTVADITSALDGERSEILTALEHERFQFLPGALPLLQCFARLSPQKRAALLAFLSSEAAE